LGDRLELSGGAGLAAGLGERFGVDVTLEVGGDPPGRERVGADAIAGPAPVSPTREALVAAVYADEIAGLGETDSLLAGAKRR
jgi:hypothetical protein